MLTTVGRMTQQFFLPMELENFQEFPWFSHKRNMRASTATLLFLLPWFWVLRQCSSSHLVTVRNLNRGKPWNWCLPQFSSDARKKMAVFKSHSAFLEVDVYVFLAHTIKYNYTKYGYTKDLEDGDIEAKLDRVPFFSKQWKNFKTNFKTEKCI